MKIFVDDIRAAPSKYNKTFPIFQCELDIHIEIMT